MIRLSPFDQKLFEENGYLDSDCQVAGRQFEYFLEKGLVDGRSVVKGAVFENENLLGRFILHNSTVLFTDDQDQLVFTEELRQTADTSVIEHELIPRFLAETDEEVIEENVFKDLDTSIGDAFVNVSADPRLGILRFQRHNGEVEQVQVVNPESLRGLIPGNPVAGVPGEKGEQGPRGYPGQQGVPGFDGKPPEHRWEGTQIQFQNPDGTWGELMDVKGEKGDSVDAEALRQKEIREVAAILNIPIRKENA